MENHSENTIFRKIKCTFFALAATLLCHAHAGAQVDSAYVAPSRQEVAVGGFSAFKQAMLSYEVKGEEYVTYQPNSPVNLGLSVSYKGFTLRGGYGFDFMRDPTRGRSEIIDFQTHFYGRRFILDLYVQDYKGMYTENDEQEVTGVYPDIRLVQYGVSWQYVFNHRQFSYRAAFNHSERQLKSAGSFQAGGGVYYNYVSSDTSLAAMGVSELNSYRLNVTGGYIYTWVFKKNVQLSAGASIGINMATEDVKKIDKNDLRALPSAQPRLAACYIGNTWTAGLSATFNFMSVMQRSDVSMMLNVGTSSVYFIKRLDVEKRWKKKQNRGQPFG